MSEYGLWSLVVLNSVIFVGFAYTFYRPTSMRDWRTFGTFGAFVVALFAEMYGFPLTIYLLSGWLQSRYPGVDWFAHDSGHLLEMVFGWQANPHFGPFHFLSMLFIGGGFVVWRKPGLSSIAHSGQARSPQPASTRTSDTLSMWASCSSCSASWSSGRLC